MGRTVLVTADNPALRATLRAALAPRRWQVAEAPRTVGAVEAAKASGADLILLDLSGGEAAGEAAARLLKLDAVTCGIPIVVLSAVERQDGQREPWAAETVCTASPAPVIAAALERALAQRHGGRPFVLVVDDEPDLVDILTTVLDQEGFAAAGALDGQEALEVVRMMTPDVLLLDLDMPRIDGWQVLERLQKQQMLARIRVVILTGQEQTVAAKQRGMRLGAADYLLKPCAPDEIVRALQTALAPKEPM